MELNYEQIGRNIARRRKKLQLTQAKVAERADICDRYMSNIERAKSIPSTEVIMRLAFALETTPDEFLVGTSHHPDERWRDVSEQLRKLDESQLELVSQFIEWVSQKKIP